MRIMIRHVSIILILLLANFALADGLPLVNGRYKTGAVLVFNLTNKQKAVIKHYNECQLSKYKTMNMYTPYIFTLTKNQAEMLKNKKGFAPKNFIVYETYKGFNDAGPHWNLVLRYSENKIEIPLALVINDTEASKAHEEQGWEPKNPCFPQQK
jgi:hypothetical protein